MSMLHFPGKRDWYLNRNILDAAVDQLREELNISREYHVPYLAGYSKDGKTIYIDSRMPKNFVPESGRRKGDNVNTDRYLILHEAVEKSLESCHLIYQLRHQIALRIERDAVQADGVPWGEYDAFMSHWINMAEREGYDHLPPDLDDTPYEDEDDPHAKINYRFTVKL